MTKRGIQDQHDVEDDILGASMSHCDENLFYLRRRRRCRGCLWVRIVGRIMPCLCRSFESIHRIAIIKL